MVRHPTSAVMPRGAAGDGSGSGQELGIAPARAVVQLTSKPPPPPAESPPSEPQPEPAAVPVSVPVSAPTPSPQPATVAPTPAASGPGFGSHGPIGAGVGGDPGEAVQVCEGEEHAFSFLLQTDGTVYEPVGVENQIVRFSDAASEPTFGLQLWDDGSGGNRGMWASGGASDGERFLAPVTEGEWHQVAVYFRASSEDDGFYIVFLDGEPVDLRTGVSLITPGDSCAEIALGPFREGERVAGLAGIHLVALGLSDGLESVSPLP